MARNALADHLDDFGHSLLRLADLDEVEVARLALGRGFRHLALVDSVGVDHNPALRRLPEHLCQPRHRQPARADDVRQHLPRSDGRQLIHIADQQKA